MPTETESGIEFTFAEDVVYYRHDRVNRLWPAVDFIIEDGDNDIWLEIKNYRRPIGRQHKLTKRQVDGLFDDLRGKFLGTTAFLAHCGEFECKKLRYVVMLEAPATRSDVLLAAQDHLKKTLHPTNSRWKVPFTVTVLDIERWNRNFPNQRARLEALQTTSKIR